VQTDQAHVGPDGPVTRAFPEVPEAAPLRRSFTVLSREPASVFPEVPLAASAAPSRVRLEGRRPGASGRPSKRADGGLRPGRLPDAC
jgi:hypothetical protein